MNTLKNIESLNLLIFCTSEPNWKEPKFNKLTLSQAAINSIKRTIAEKEGILEIDITDEDVFIYMRDIEQLDGHFPEPRSISDLINDLDNPDPQGWLAMI